MSSSSSYAVTSSPSSSSSSSFFLANLSNLGLGYAIAIALAALVLLSSLLLASYLCFRRQNLNPNLNPNSVNSNGVSIPRIIFVNDDDDDEDIEQLPRSGLDQAVINSYPKFKFKEVKGSDNNNNGNSNNLCSICLCEFKEGEMLRMMADCRHYFHLCCIDAWLRLNGSCPICRNSPLPTPLSTPLSEVVPLSQYAADWRRR